MVMYSLIVTLAGMSSRSLSSNVPARRMARITLSSRASDHFSDSAP